MRITNVGCYNPSLQVVKSAAVSNTNLNGLTDVGDIITYTVVVTNTGGLPILFTSIDDKLKYGSTTQPNIRLELNLNQCNCGAKNKFMLLLKPN